MIHDTYSSVRPSMLALIAGLSLAAGASVSLGQSKSEGSNNGGPRKLTGTFDRPLGSGSNTSSGGATSVSVMSESNGDDTFTVKIDGDEITVTHNGKEVPKDRIRSKNGHVEILDKDGDVVKTFEVRTPDAPKAGARGSGSSGSSSSSRAPRAARTMNTPWPATPPAATSPMEQMFPPPVMVGMLMDYSEDEGGIVVQRVFEGMPAEKAGIMADDVIIKIDGKKVEKIESLREAMDGKKPGDKLTVVVKRDDEEKSLTINLIKYDKEVMAKARGEEAEMVMPPEAQKGGHDQFTPFPGHTFSWSGDGKIQDEIKKAVEKALATVKRDGAGEAEKWKGDVVRALEEALSTVEKSSGQLRGQLRAMQGEGKGNTMIFRERPGQVFTVPPTPAAPRTPDMSNQLEKLNKNLEKLNKRLDEMERRLNDKN